MTKMKLTMSGKRTPRIALAVVAIVAIPILAGGCGSDKESTPTTTPTTNSKCSEPGEHLGTGNDKKVISLSPTATEMVYAIGGLDQMIAVDNMSNFPQAAGGSDSKLSGLEPNVEAIAGMDPDVVLISYDPGNLKSQLSKLGIEVWEGLAATTVEDSYDQIEQLGELTGHQDGATAVVDCMKKKLDSIVSSSKDLPQRDYYFELDNMYFSVTSNTFMGDLLSKLNLKSIADGVEAGNDWPQLNVEKIVTADPDFIFLADTKCCAQNAAAVAGRPGWAAMSAVTNSNIVELDDDVASRWGPRVVELLQSVVEATK